VSELADSHDRARSVAYAYLEAKAFVLASGFGWEIDWQEDAARDEITEGRFMQELAWVVLSSGLGERTVRATFARITGAFGGWDAASEIWSGRSECRQRALLVFNSPRKINAILTAAGYVSKIGFAAVRTHLSDERAVEFLMRLPFLGPATARHLAKNLGINVAKPDRHLQRLADRLGYDDVTTLCHQISTVVGDSIAVVDVVLWRFATLRQSSPAFA
jgi:hypothetical protein